LATDHPFEVRLGDGRSVGVPPSFDSEALGRVLRVLEAARRSSRARAASLSPAPASSPPPPGYLKTLATRRSFPCALRLDNTETCWGSTVR
jgi:hypothetical protein